MSTVIGAGVRGARGRRFRGAPLRLGTATPAATYQFYYSGRASGIPEYVGTTPWGASQVINLILNGALTGGYIDSPAGEPFAQGVNTPSNASNTVGFCTLAQGRATVTMKYTPSITSGAQFLSLEGSAKDVLPLDTNDQIVLIAASSANSFKVIFKGVNGTSTVSTPDLTMFGAAINTDFVFNFWWNTAGPRYLILQIGIDPPAVYGGILPIPLCTQWHTLRWGKDAVSGQAMGVACRETYLYTTSGFQVTGNAWCDFNFTGAVSVVKLAASSHNSQLTCYIENSATRWSTNVDAYYPQWASINNQTSSSTTGLCWDLSLTTAGSVGWGVAASDQPWSHSFMFKVPTIANTNTIEMCGAYDTGFNRQVAVLQTAAGGVQTLFLQNGSAGNSTSITVTTGTWYLVCINGLRSQGGGELASLRVYDTTKTQVGTTVTVLTSARNCDRWWLGTFDPTTAQSAGVIARFSHLILDGPPSNSSPVTPLLQWAA